jgi:hypothetical protein
LYKSKKNVLSFFNRRQRDKNGKRQDKNASKMPGIFLQEIGGADFENINGGKATILSRFVTESPTHARDKPESNWCRRALWSAASSRRFPWREWNLCRFAR